MTSPVAFPDPVFLSKPAISRHPIAKWPLYRASTIEGLFAEASILFANANNIAAGHG
jgi:hypothetical protein